MAVKRKTINLAVEGNTLVATDAETGLPATDAGVQGEDGAVWLHVEVPEDWRDLSVRLQVMASSGDCDVSGLPLAGVIDMPLRSSVTVPGKLIVTLTGTSPEGVRRTAECGSLNITASSCPVDAVSDVYPLAFENLAKEVATGVVHKITGSGGAKVTKTDDTTYNIDVSGTGGDMLKANYAAGLGASNPNTVDRALYADTTGEVENAKHAGTADTAAAAVSAAEGSELESAINSKQDKLTPGGSGGVDLLCGTTVKSLKGSGINITSDDTSVTLAVNGAPLQTGAVVYFAKPLLPQGWLPCNGQQIKKTDYPELYRVISDRFGIGKTEYISVIPEYLTDNINPAFDIVLQKYANGIQDANYFATGGTVFTGDEVKISTPGDYTFYCKDSSGNEAVQYVRIPSITAPYILNLVPFMTSEMKLLLYVEAGWDSINLVKFSAGIQPLSYFSNNGTNVGTSDSAYYAFQDGTPNASGVYTFYTCDESGNAAIQYFKVSTRKELTIYLELSFGSEYFRVPNLIGTLNDLLYPGIKT